mmetsp:Transcript_2708/g.6016  ORF Transcript_2708/g.6016 Transcript_2708/m.6016 type:complete len:276 (-) Transcript_2708:65-892(-)
MLDSLRSSIHSRRLSVVDANKENMPPPTHKRVASNMTELTCATYRAELKSALTLSELSVNTSNCLERHKITEFMRSKMVDWMVEVLNAFSLSTRTLFLSVRLMDSFFKQSQNTLFTSDLHLIGVVCMFVASKFEDVKPLKMKQIFEKIGHRRLPISSIHSAERVLLSTLDYQVSLPTLLDFLEEALIPEPEEVKKRAMALAEVVLLSAEISSMPAETVAESLYQYVKYEKSERDRMPTQGPLALALQSLRCFFESYSYELKEFRATAIKHGGNFL